MTLVGHLHYRIDPHKAKLVYAYAAVAKAEGIDYVYFTPRRINVNNRTVTGFMYNNGAWSETQTRLPDAVINEATRTEKFWPAVEFLQRRVPFTSHPIGDKLSVYNRIYRGKKFREYLIPSAEITRASKDLPNFLQRYHRVILKPLSGSKGQGITMIQKDEDDKYRIVENGITNSVSFQGLLHLVEERQRAEPQLLQKYISCFTKNGDPYDFRLHVQKNGSGRWVIPAVYCRVARAGNITSNLSSGGFSSFTETFLQHEFGDQSYNMKCYLEQLGLQLAVHLDEIYQESFDELGIDIGIDEIRKAWIYEVNWKPGPPPNFYLELDIPRNALRYAVHLANRKERQVST